MTFRPSFTNCNREQAAPPYGRGDAATKAKISPAEIVTMLKRMLRGVGRFPLARRESGGSSQAEEADRAKVDRSWLRFRP
jgi:hypothetical protein